jgi:hypothetical protein
MSKKRLELRASDVPEDLYNQVVEEAKKEKRSVPKQLIVIVEAFFDNK